MPMRLFKAPAADAFAQELATNRQHIRLPEEELRRNRTRSKILRGADEPRSRPWQPGLPGLPGPRPSRLLTGAIWTETAENYAHSSVNWDTLESGAKASAKHIVPVEREQEASLRSTVSGSRDLVHQSTKDFWGNQGRRNAKDDGDEDSDDGPYAVITNSLHRRVIHAGGLDAQVVFFSEFPELSRTRADADKTFFKEATYLLRGNQHSLAQQCLLSLLLLRMTRQLRPTALQKFLEDVSLPNSTVHQQLSTQLHILLSVVRKNAKEQYGQQQMLPMRHEHSPTNEARHPALPAASGPKSIQAKSVQRRSSPGQQATAEQIQSFDVLAQNPYKSGPADASAQPKRGSVGELRMSDLFRRDVDTMAKTMPQHPVLTMLTAHASETDSPQHTTRSEQKMPHLLDDLRKRHLPRHHHGRPPGDVGKGCWWVCIMCLGKKQNTITKTSTDMQLHLDSHGYSTEHIAYVFDLTNGEALFAHFGPYTEREAHKYGLAVDKWRVEASTTATKSLRMSTVAKPVTFQRMAVREHANESPEMTQPSTPNKTATGTIASLPSTKATSDILMQLSQVDIHKEEKHFPTKLSSMPSAQRRDSPTNETAFKDSGTSAWYHVINDTLEKVKHKHSSASTQLWCGPMLPIQEPKSTSHLKSRNTEAPSTGPKSTSIDTAANEGSEEAPKMTGSGDDECKGLTSEVHTLSNKLERLTLRKQNSRDGVGDVGKGQLQQEDRSGSSHEGLAPFEGSHTRPVLESATSGSPNSSSSSSPSGNAGSFPSGEASKNGNSAKKRKCDDASDDDNNEQAPNDGGDGRDNNPGASADDQSKTIACPYWIEDPQKYHPCSTKILRDIAGLKQHLERVHKRPENYCHRCFQAFNADATLNQHLRGFQCTQTDYNPYGDQIDKDKWKCIKKRHRGKSPSEVWKVIYVILFPDRDATNTSPYMEDQRDLPSVVLLVDLLKSYPAIAQYLQNDRINPSGSRQSLPDNTLIILDKALDQVGAAAQSGKLQFLGISANSSNTSLSLSADTSGNDSVDNNYYEQARCAAPVGQPLSSVARVKQAETQDGHLDWQGDAFNLEDQWPHDMEPSQQHSHDFSQVCGPLTLAQDTRLDSWTLQPGLNHLMDSRHPAPEHDQNDDHILAEIAAHQRASAGWHHLRMPESDLPRGTHNIDQYRDPLTGELALPKAQPPLLDIDPKVLGISSQTPQMHRLAPFTPQSRGWPDGGPCYSNADGDFV